VLFADIHLVDAAAVPRRHGNQVHVFLMVGAVLALDHGLEARHL
jgi:hypothetical protein